MENKFINLMISKLESGQIEAPYFKKLTTTYGLNEDEIKTIMELFTGGKVVFLGYVGRIYNQNDQEIYQEYFDGGEWVKTIYNTKGETIRVEFPDEIREWIYDEKGNIIEYRHTPDYWIKYKYDKKNRKIYQEKSDGEWIKWKYNQKGWMIYSEESDGYWLKKDYDKNGDLIYMEDSIDGVTTDKR